MPLSRSLIRLAIIGAVWHSAVAEVWAADRTAPELLPAGTVIYAEIRHPQSLIEMVYDHPLAARFEALDEVRTAMEKKPYLDFKAAVAVVESQLGLPWRKIAAQATGGGLAVAVDPKTQGVVILARATDDATHAKLLETLANLAGLDAKSKGKSDPVEVGEYRDVKTYKLAKAGLASVQGWLIATNKEELGKQIIDNILGSPKESLASDEQFAKAHAAASDSTCAWAYVNVATLRDAGLAKNVFGGQADNLLAELFFGGILNTLQHTPYATVGLEINDRQVQLAASAPYDRAWAGESREYYFGPQGMGAAPSRLSPEETILVVSGYRNISAMWLHAGDLLNEQSNQELAKADSGLTTLFAGKDFGEDILGAFRPEGQFVVVRQRFAEGEPAPAIKLPAFGLIAEMKDPAKMQPELRRIFQSMIGFFNIVGAMNGQPQLELDMDKTGDVQLITSSYLADPDAEDPQALKINYNFSPTIAFVGSRFIIASTKAFAQKLAAAAGGTATTPRAPEGEKVVNTDAMVNFDALKETLADNRGQLVAQNMLKEGHTKEEAERAIGVFLDLVGWVDHAGLGLETTASELRLSVHLDLKTSN